MTSNLRSAVKWVLRDMAFKAPEQIDYEMSRRWYDRLKEAFDAPDETAAEPRPTCLHDPYRANNTLIVESHWGAGSRIRCGACGGCAAIEKKSGAVVPEACMCHSPPKTGEENPQTSNLVSRIQHWMGSNGQRYECVKHPERAEHEDRWCTGCLMKDVLAALQVETPAESMKPELLVLVMDWILNEEGWRPTHPPSFFNSKFEKLARAAQAEWDAIQSSPKTP